ncbi:cytochrome c-type biogenesis protein CcmH [Amycolatopsis marina]|uniref:Cytochrome c-type biogenesis protein n=1 Tax=Amycolatopsis marina TaxID=490629 RepID=A0A1I1CJ47_9PSEU|nr:cytochrome c-type biogenesis protein [Amycolatopsis marina]SFB62701.1 cytochrome c-type biogenesis protein CcmH [Amycolatopsis marina]
MRRRRLSQAGLAMAILSLLAVAVVGLLTAGSGPADRAYELEQRLRCPVCKSVSIAESPSETAQIMRIAVAEQVAAGRSDQEIIGYFRARYGDWVLLDPPASGATLILWVLPVAAVVVGGIAVFLVRRRPEPGGDLTAEQRERVGHAVEQARSTGDDEGL